MSSINLKHLMNRLPNERAAIVRLEALLNSLRDQSAKGGTVPEYTFDHLYQKAGFSSPEALSVVLADLVDRGEIQKRVRVESPSTRGGMCDYEYMQNVPETGYN